MKTKKFEGILLICIAVFLVALAIDLGTKAWAEYYFGELGNKPFELIPGFMTLRLTYNTGMAFSMFADNPIAMKIITWLSLPVIIGFGVMVYVLPSSYNACRVLLSLVASGAFANFIDRVFVEKGVRDFMDISSIGFGVCNFADYCITLGGAALMIILVYKILTDKEED